MQFYDTFAAKRSSFVQRCFPHSVGSSLLRAGELQKRPECGLRQDQFSNDSAPTKETQVAELPQNMCFQLILIILKQPNSPPETQLQKYVSHRAWERHFYLSKRDRSMPRSRFDQNLHSHCRDLAKSEGSCILDAEVSQNAKMSFPRSVVSTKKYASRPAWEAQF